jgi:hypothetical protein
MDFERTRREAEWVETRERLRKVELSAEALLTQLRLVTDPLVADAFVDLDIKRAVELVEELQGKWEQAKELGAREKRLREALGRTR